jgi:electron transfer flavoprotein-quinone oxidoreductase
VIVAINTDPNAPIFDFAHYGIVGNAMQVLPVLTEAFRTHLDKRIRKGLSPRSTHGEKFDAIVVGAGPSGNTAAYTLAKAGLKVLQIERGEYPGSKNVQGAILYADALEQIIPDFRDDAPLERHIIEQRMWVLDDNSFVGTHYRSDDYNKPPYNRYTIIRAQFDKWFSSKVREAGALLICETTVEELLMDGNRCIGVRCDRQGGEVFADVVILADGVNSTLARKAGFHGEIQAGNVALAVKEILFMPEDHPAALQHQGRRRRGHRDDGHGHRRHGGHRLPLHQQGLADHRRRLHAQRLQGQPEQAPRPTRCSRKLKRTPRIAPLIEGGEMKEYART